MIIFSLVHAGEPLTKSNTLQTSFKGKKARRFVYIPARIKAYEASLREHAERAIGRRRPTKKYVKMTVHFYLGTKRRKDLQNLDKSLCDAFNGIVYKDDNQIHELHEYKHLDRDNPRVEVVIETINNSTWAEDKEDDSSDE